MQREHRSRQLPQGVLLAGAAASFAAVVASMLLPSAAATVVSALALAALGAAAIWLTLVRVGPITGERLRGRTLAVWRKQRVLAVVAAGSLYMALVLGTAAMNSGALWDCTTWPTCTPDNSGAILAMVHRGAAALTSVLVVALAFVVLRGREGRGLRVVARWSIGLIVAQNTVGLVQVLLAANNARMPVSTARFTHLIIGGLAWAAVVVLATLVVRMPPARRVAAVPAEAVVKQPSLLKDYVSLTKPGVISLLIFTTFASMFITPAGTPGFWLVFWTMIGGWLMPAGAHALNCYFDRDIDVLMGRTGRRPIPSGRIPAWHALVLGLVLGVIAFVILAVFVNMVTALLALAGYIYYVVFYTLILKRNSVQNIVIGGGAGAFPPLVGWAAATGNLSLASVLLFMIIFYWTPPHFWALALIRRADYANAGVPMLPVVAGDGETKKQIVLYTLLMVMLTILPTPIGMFGLAYLLMAVGLGAWFCYYVVKMVRDDTTANRWGLYRFSLLYLFLLFVAMMIDRLAFA